MKIESEHLDAQTLLLREILEAIHAQSQRVRPDVATAAFTVSTAGTYVVVPGTPGNRIYVESFMASAGGTVTLTIGATRGGTNFKPFPGITDAANTDPLALPLSAGENAHMTQSFPAYLFALDAGDGVAIKTGQSVAVAGFFTYWVA